MLALQTKFSTPSLCALLVWMSLVGLTHSFQDEASHRGNAPTSSAIEGPETPSSPESEEKPENEEKPQIEKKTESNEKTASGADVQLAGELDNSADEPIEIDPDPLLTTNFSKAMVIEVEGAIFGRFQWYLNNRLDLAEKAGVDLVIVRLTSPGGDLEASLQLARRLRDIKWAKTMIYVPEEAISGGAIISLGADRIFMQKGALIGDAGPIRLGMDGQFRFAEEKIVSYLAEAVRELAVAKGRPPALAEAMADRTLKLFAAKDRTTDVSTILSEKETQDPANQAQYDIGLEIPESGQNRFLTLGAERALELHVCEGVFESEQAMLGKLNIDNVEFTRMNWVDRTVYLLNRPWLTALLLIAGLVGLYLELIAPGVSVAGLSSMLCFGIFFWSHALGGTSGWLEFLLFFLGIACVVMELFVLPGFGVFGIAGIGLISFSLVMASQDFLVPQNAIEWQQLQTNTFVVLGSVCGVIVLFLAQILLLDSLPGMNRFRLAAPEASVVVDERPATSLAASPMAPDFPIIAIGDQATAESDLRPSGKVRLGDRLLDVVTEGDYVDAGSAVEVVRVAGNQIMVRIIK